MDLTPEIHKKLLSKRYRGSMTIHYDGKGNATPEVRLMADAVMEMFTEKKDYKSEIRKEQK